MEGDDHGEAYTAIARGGLLSRESYNTQRPRPLTEAEGNMSGTVMRLRRNLGDLASGRAALAAPVRAGKAMSFSRR